MKRTKKSSLLIGAAAVTGVAMGASIAMAAHPKVPLYTYEEVANQFYGPKSNLDPMGAPAQQMKVAVDPTTHRGFPYSPKQTCSGGDNAACHNYAAISKHAFHASLGFNEWMDNDPSGLFIAPADVTLNDANKTTVKAGTQTGLNPQKPWLQSHGHNGKW